MKTTKELLSRDAFREGVFARDAGLCVNCGAQGQDAHHIVERRLFEDGGYYLDNGATLCGQCHINAESTILTCNDIRQKAHIGNIVLPPHLYPDTDYDKWGNIILPSGQRIKGELFYDESVQKVIKPVLHEFTNHVKYPRTHHLPWSPNLTKDDKRMPTLDSLNGQEVVMTEKLDGENTSLYYDGLHARSLDYNPHPSRDRIKALWASIQFNIPEGWRICGENCFAAHSIHYKHLTSYFYVFGIWNEKNICLDWDSTVEWADLFGLKTVPVLYRGIYNEGNIRNAFNEKSEYGDEVEGYVVRVAREFSYRDFRYVVGKYVRKGHVRTHAHWMNRTVVPNIIDYTRR